MELIITIPKNKYNYIQELEKDHTDYATTMMLYHVVKHGKLLSVTPQQKTGRWVQKEEEGDAEPFIIWECSECHGYQRKQTAFCPDCGTKMEVEE